MTLQVKVPQATVDSLRAELERSQTPSSAGVTVEQQLLEATATAASYNMVSRLLVALDVADEADASVPFPAAPSDEIQVTASDGVKLHVRVSKRAVGSPWILLINSLMTNLSMWDGAAASLTRKYNVITFDQRGHGKVGTVVTLLGLPWTDWIRSLLQSSVPSPVTTTVDQLADDVAAIVGHLGLVSALHAVIGVSQGGATALNVAIRHPKLAQRYVACDTQHKTPPANKVAWDERIELARSKGMGALAEATVSRWFPAGSEWVEGRYDGIVRRMIADTPLDGFVAGARALQDYDLTPGLSAALEGKRALLVAGERDGKLPETLQNLANELKGQGRDVEFASVPGSGHLPMLDGLRVWLEKVEAFLDKQ
jgi:pimeloyl-ACP methyl ester carboxylesterase